MTDTPLDDWLDRVSDKHGFGEREAVASTTPDTSRGLTAWRSARSAAVAKIQDVVKQVAADGGDEVAEMTGWVRALKSNLPTQPSSAQEIARVRSFLQSDEDMVDLDEELGIAGPMLSALDELEQGTGGA